MVWKQTSDAYRTLIRCVATLARLFTGSFQNGFERECGNRFLLQLPIDSTRELTVTVLPFEVFQRLTNAWGTPKTTEVV
jgi:hypothetical protein